MSTSNVTNRSRHVGADYITTMPREAQDRKGMIRTYSGLYVNPLKMRARDIRIADIAHHLSLICRYTGACPKHYSVAQHSLLVSYHLRDEGASYELQLAGLLHDAAEYVLNDIASPVKHDPRMAWYRDLDHELTRMIFCVFGVNPDLLLLTKAADDAVFREEVAAWWGPEGAHRNFAVPGRHAANVEADFKLHFDYLQRKLDA